jgi:hypothetical protein
VVVISAEVNKTIPPPPASAKVLSPLKKVVASLVPVAVRLASETVLSAGVTSEKDKFPAPSVIKF